MEGPNDDACSVSDSSPLQNFVSAKKNINDIFVEIEDYVRESVTYMQSVQQDGSIVRSDDAVQVEGYIAKVKAIRNVLTRNHMKVAFFGRTSNGKSSVINAMLREKILPSGCGHTTNCFLQVEGSNSGESYLTTEGSTERQDVNSVGQLAHALSQEKLEEGQLMHIYWSKDKCLLLRSDVVFVDSPGIDMSPDFDEWIERHCQDADVFVFVAHAASTLTLAEKNFFRKVSTRLAKPNIFILNNYWDVVASECNFDEVRAQQMEQAVKFLVEELKVCTREEANQRIFFVSAKEVLQARLQEQRGLPADNGALADGFPDRYFEFEDFERKFEECISKSAVRTKFEQHSQRGKLIVSEICKIIDSTYNKAEELKTQKAVAKKEILNNIKPQLLLLTQEMKDKMQQIVEDTEKMESKAESLRVMSMIGLVCGALPVISEVLFIPSAVAFCGNKMLYESQKKDNEENARKLKQQFAAQITEQMKKIVDQTSANCSHQGEQEVSETFAQLCHFIDGVINDMDAEIKTLDKEIKQLEEAASSAKVLRNKANHITKQLEIFNDAFLKLCN